jgi:UMF1 family MFS transporter
VSQEPAPIPTRGALLHALALDRPELRAWALYDWGNSAFVTTVITAVFPIYFASVVAEGWTPTVATARFAMATTVAQLLVALLCPFAGVLADELPIKKKLLAGGLALGALPTALLAFVGPGDQALALVLFALGNIGLMGSFVFYDALLPHLARDAEIDRVSAAGYALGYLGGGLLLALNLLWIQRPSWFGLADAASASRLSFLSVALWWVGFSLPLFRHVPEPALPPRTPGDPGPLRAAFARLAGTSRALRAYPQALLLLVAYLLYNDGIGTIYRMASIYGTEIGLSRGALIAAILVTQFASIPFAFLFGALADRIGPKPSLFLALGVYVLIAVFGYFLRTELHFLGLALLVALVQGGAQSLSRSLYATFIPKARSAQYFSLFGVFDKVSGIAGPALFALVATLAGSSREAILSVLFFFVAGALVLAFVDVDEGRSAARRGA